jgi:hypothetical protein
MRSRPGIVRDVAALLLGLALGGLAVTACRAAPRLGSERSALLASGCAGAVAALALLLERAGERGGRRDAIATAALLAGLCSSIVLILVCAVATQQHGE